jgi:Protein of unknown function (DUF3515)
VPAGRARVIVHAPARVTAALSVPAAVLTAALLVGTLASCSQRPVRTQPPPPPTAPAAEACARLHAALPDSLDGHRKRDTKPASGLTAAWGDPPIILHCGVPVPAAYGPAAQLYTINGVDWFAEELTAGYVFTTIGREAGVELTVPDDYKPEVNPVVDLSVVVARTVPVSPTAPPTPTGARSGAPAPPR